MHHRNHSITMQSFRWQFWEGKKSGKRTNCDYTCLFIEVTPQWAKNINSRCLAESCYLPVQSYMNCVCNISNDVDMQNIYYIFSKFPLAYLGLYKTKLCNLP